MKKMKKILKRVSPLFFALMLTLMCTVVVEARTVNHPTRTVTVYSRATRSYNGFLRGYMSSNQSIQEVIPRSRRVTGLRSSRSSVVSLSVKNGTGTSRRYKAIMLNAKKPGTATVSYKIGNVNHRVKIVVKKYTSPFSKLYVGRSNLLSKFNKNGIYYMKYSTYRNKSVRIRFQPKKGWTLSASYLQRPGDMQAPIVRDNKSIRIRRRNSALIFDAYNEKTKQNESCTIIFR